MPVERVIPVGRDHLAILGEVFGVAFALSDTNTEYRPRLNDYITEALFRIESPGSNPTWGVTLQATEDAGAAYAMIIHCTSDRVRLLVGGNNYYSTATLNNYYGQWIHIIVFHDRSGFAYIFVNGDYFDAIDISADVTTDLTSDTLTCFGRANAANRGTSGQCARLFVIPPANFPTEVERKAIAAERFVDPDNESPTIVALGLDGAAKRLDVGLVDVNQDGATVPNDGTGGDPTIGGGLAWRNVRTRAVRTAIITPDEDWYSFDALHNAINAAAALGCAQGSYIYEVIYRDLFYGSGLSAARPFYLYNVGATERFYADITGLGYYAACHTDSAVYSTTIQTAAGDYPDYARFGIHVMHFIYDADMNEWYPIINGQIIDTHSVVADLNLSGDLQVGMGLTNRQDGIIGMRLWNWPSLPADWKEEIHRRVENPWCESESFGGTVSEGLKGEWLGKASAQKASSTVLVNRPQPGVGDLLISGGSTWGASRVLAVAGQ